MSESKFTPGPWHVDGFNLSGVIRQDEVGEWHNVAQCDMGAFKNPNWRHDARLIASAPELYNALRQIVDARTIPSAEMYEAARAALAKAKVQSE